MQPTFLGYLGFYDLMRSVDVMVLDDLAQYVSKSWHSRNLIQARDGNRVWLSVPVHGGRVPLNEVRIAGQGWQYKHIRTIDAAYSHTPGWEGVLDVAGIIGREWEYLAALNHAIILEIKDQLGIRTPVFMASWLDGIRHGLHERIVDFARAAGADTLLTPARAAEYIDTDRLDGLTVEWWDYQPREWEQDGPPYLSVLDTIAHHPAEALHAA